MINYAEVTVCIPTYNSSDTLPKTLESALNQSFTNFKLLIVDDNSTENIKQIVKSYGDPRIRFVKNDVNLGILGNWNKCLELADTPYILILHDDDILHPEALFWLLTYIKEYEDLAIVASRKLTFSHHTRLKFPEIDPINLTCKIYKSKDLPTFVINENCYLPCSSVLFRRKSLTKIGKFDEKYTYSPDEELWPRILYKGYSIGIIEYPFVFRRVSGQNFMYVSWTKSDFIEQYISIHKDILRYSDFNERVERAIKQKLAQAFTHIGFYHLIRSSFEKSVEYYQSISVFPEGQSLPHQIKLAGAFIILAFVSLLYKIVK